MSTARSTQNESGLAEKVLTVMVAVDLAVELLANTLKNVSITIFAIEQLEKTLASAAMSSGPQQTVILVHPTANSWGGEKLSEFL